MFMKFELKYLNKQLSDFYFMKSDSVLQYGTAIFKIRLKNFKTIEFFNNDKDFDYPLYNTLKSNLKNKSFDDVLDVIFRLGYIPIKGLECYRYFQYYYHENYGFIEHNTIRKNIKQQQYKNLYLDDDKEVIDFLDNVDNMEIDDITKKYIHKYLITLKTKSKLNNIEFNITKMNVNKSSWDRTRNNLTKNKFIMNIGG